MELTSDYDYDLPEELIAQAPLANRADSRLIFLNRCTGDIQDLHFRDVVDILQPGDLLVRNETRVTAKRLFGRRPTGATVEALLMREIGDRAFEAMVKPGKRLKPGSVIEFESGLRATVEADLEEPLKRINFDPAPDLRERLDAVGRVPLPPYIHGFSGDAEQYQTVYAKKGGSAAAPTAGLHFTPGLIHKLENKGVQITDVSLDVSLDTFRPVTVDVLQDHPMHGEICRIPEGAANAINQAEGRIIAVGTTSVRTLESFAVGKRKVRSGEMRTSLFIRPGYDWQVIDGMFTNFHLPRTTMLAMISALAGRDRIFHAYHHAIQHHYRFLSFGDSMLIL
ncbi:MAG TPA: tRNA preQ1(34) S-adenosylmethionine ribosyltransferase-isomerase QueA [Fimbriimonadaceae bacterium]|nr:tRNA preQ1(34) S-adenosylmethionine ribosyltransferase-isomerase QueA [Fimbriimonadaceae bacterium]